MIPTFFKYVYCPQLVRRIQELKLKYRMFERNQPIKLNLLHSSKAILKF